MTEPFENPYAAPRADISGPPAAAAEGLDMTKDEARAYVGPKSLYYWGTWQRAQGARTLMAGFNWAACIFSLAWMLYRKMFREFFAAMAIIVVFSAGLGALGGAAGVDTRPLERAIDLAIAVVTGFLGNGLYLRRARRVIAEARAQQPDEAKRMELLMLRGGTSRLWPAVAIVVSLGLIILAGS